jgi:NADH-quinone oxidoreductase subunit G
MAKITLNGREVDVPDGVNLIQAAETVGVTIPHYCYHPGLPIDGNCRMCLVEIDGARGPQISCNTFVKDGMVVHTDTPAVEKMRKGVQEFLLLNHPIDCPICDQAGECRLQDYYMEYGQYQNRSMVEKVEKNKVVDLGPLVVLDQERCILCSRCVRFCESVTKTGELVIAGRGDHSRIETFPGKKLDNPYSGNVVDVCPVGALTSKDFRFKQRVWFLTITKSICTGCANGCATFVDHRDGTSYRYRPRHNPLVNNYWMCDEGRLSYHALNEDRLVSAMTGGEKQPIGLAMDAVVAKIKVAMKDFGPDSVAFVGSAHASVEANYVMKRLATEVVGTKNVWGVTLTPDGHADDFLIKADKTPNRRAFKLLGLNEDADALKRELSGGKIKVLVALDRNDLAGEGGSEWADLLNKVPDTIYFATHIDDWAPMATVTLPVATHVEQYGTYIQAKGVLQKVMKAYDADGDAVPSYEALGSLARALGTEFEYDDVEQVWTHLREAYPDQLGGLSFYGIPEHGHSLAVPALATP